MTAQARTGPTAPNVAGMIQAISRNDRAEPQDQREQSGCRHRSPTSRITPVGSANSPARSQAAGLSAEPRLRDDDLVTARQRQHRHGSYRCIEMTRIHLGNRWPPKEPAEAGKLSRRPSPGCPPSTRYQAAPGSCEPDPPRRRPAPAATPSLGVRYL